MPRHILVNATNLTGAGALGVGLSLIPALVQAMPDRAFLLLLPDVDAYHALVFPPDTDIAFFSRPSGAGNNLRRVEELFVTVPRLARQVGANVCLTLGDVSPIGLPCPSVTLLHQPLLVYSQDELQGLGGWSLPKRLVMTRFLTGTARKSACIIVQTPVMAERLANKYPVERERIAVIPNPVPQRLALEATKEDRHPKIAACAKPIKLLFLAAYYPHKNHAILPAVAEELHRRGLDNRVHFFLTLDENKTESAKVRSQLRCYPDLFTNLGYLSPPDVASALRASDALFMPTLVESFGLIYLEAMMFRLPILTSDRDFAHWMCRDLALYFDPTDPVSIVDIIEATPSFPAEPAKYSQAAALRLSEFPSDWDATAEQFADILRHEQR